MVGVFTTAAKITTHATTPEAAPVLLRCNTQHHIGARRFCEGCVWDQGVVDGLVKISSHSTTPDAARWLCSAICNITSGPDASVQAAFATKKVVDALVKISTNAHALLALPSFDPNLAREWLAN
ncbi:Hypothetical protein, putative [Bodo saltans]|uniref:Uncharacterized protein n=1 Tax=Bodo saltans TaxID=75058 RepID=A0A0S4IYA3_BODSA|nr:Hypothetical protein, putative [Bodo saltans]|eukprot:CUG18457.1 Hypothetical protein, putative [Bodo saltans]